MIGLPVGTRVWLVVSHTDMREGIDGLDALVQGALTANSLSGNVFVFHGRHGDFITVLWVDGQSLMLLAKRLERGRFAWPQATSGSVSLLWNLGDVRSLAQDRLVRLDKRNGAPQTVRARSRSCTFRRARAKLDFDLSSTK